MVKILSALLVMTVLFLGGVLTGINQTETRTEQAPPRVEVLPETKAIQEATPVTQEPVQDSLSADVMEGQSHAKAGAVHLTQKLAAGLESIITGLCNLLIQSVYQLVKVFFL